MKKFELDYRQLEALNVVCESGGFEAAALKLLISQSAVSQRIKALETYIGQPLLVRQSPPKPTPLGQALLRHWQKVKQLESHLLSELGSESQWTKIAIALNSDSLSTWFLDAIKPILLEHKILLELVVDDQDVTASYLREGRVFASISSEAFTSHGCEAHCIGQMTYICVASPSFKQRYFAQGVTRKSLVEAPAIIFGPKDQTHAYFLRKHFNVTKPLVKYHQIPYGLAFNALTVWGAAYGLIPTIGLREEMQEGKLVDLAPGKSINLRLYWHSWQLKTPILQAVEEKIVQAAVESLR